MKYEETKYDIGGLLIKLMKLDDGTGRVSLETLRARINQFFPRLYPRGSSFGFLAEVIYSMAQNEYEFVDRPGYDFVRKDNPKDKIEMKSLTTSSGVCFMPSSNVGAGRKTQSDADFSKTCAEKDFLVADHKHFLETSEVRYWRFSGKDIARLGKRVSYSKWKKIFEGK